MNHTKPQSHKEKMNENNIGKIVLDCAVSIYSKAHKKQLLTYLRLTNCKLGYLLNFGEALMKDGISRIINGNL